MEGSKSRTHKRRHDKEITHKLALLQEPPNSSQISGGRWTYHNHVDLNPNATDIRITIPHSDDEFIDLFGAVLIIKRDSSGLIPQPQNILTAMESLGTYRPFLG